MKNFAVAAVLASVDVLGSNPVAAFEPSGQTAQTHAAATQRVAARADNASTAPSRAAPDYRAIVEAGGPAVVGVTVAGLHTPTADDEDQEVAAQDPILHFLRGLPALLKRPRSGAVVPFRGQGSGFIVSADGLILTNAHVVHEAGEVIVKLRDRREFAATVLGADQVTDVAVLRIDAKGLPIVRIGDPSRLQVGDPVLAIGAPFGFEQTATQGIVSAKGRSLPGDTLVPFIQTDAAVNPGNSGGPLFDAAGDVVGINAQIYSRSGGFEGLSFAIPIDVALAIKNRIVATGQVIHARLGVTVQDLDQALAEAFGLARPDGALVSSVAKDSPAERSGLRAGDVITHVDGRLLEHSGALPEAVALATPGEVVQLELWRDGAAHRIETRLGQAPAAPPVHDNEPSPLPSGQLGLTLRALTSQERRELGGAYGLVVERVAGAAMRAGVQPGDLIKAVNGTPVRAVEQVVALLQAKPRAVALLVQRGGESLYVPVTPG
jgi:serine protease Do